MNIHHKINYIEMPAKDLDKTKQFFAKAFGWSFVDYGPDYCSFSDQGIDGGFYRSDLVVSASTGAPLVVLYSANLERSLADVVAAGGAIMRPIFTFPGGRRFHFSDPSGNEYAVWSE